MPTEMTADICTIESVTEADGTLSFSLRSLQTDRHYRHQEQKTKYNDYFTAGKMVALVTKTQRTELAPVTVGFTVELVDQPRSPGFLEVMAMPRPSPLLAATDNQSLLDTIRKAADAEQGMAFALADHQRIIAAVPLSRAEALNALGMSETR